METQVGNHQGTSSDNKYQMTNQSREITDLRIVPEARHRDPRPWDRPPWR